jgi:probable F420-dependent oxidoreductase
MRIGIAVPNYGPLASADVIGALAERVEASGLDSVWVSDHLLAPVGVKSIYPYDPRPRPTPSDVSVLEQMYEPLMTLGWLAGRTRRVRLGVSAYIVPYRNPVVTAKLVATLDALSGGRLTLAVGSGWLREEFAALHVPFTNRGRRLEEYLAICDALWAGGDAHYEGHYYQLPPVRTGPRPAQRPRPPIWIAGNSRRVIERAARIGDGWHPIDLGPDELAAGVARLHRLLDDIGRPRDAVRVTLRSTVGLGATSGTRRPFHGDVAAVRADLDAYRAAGLQDLVLGLRREATRDALLHQADATIAAFGGRS